MPATDYGRHVYRRWKEHLVGRGGGVIGVRWLLQQHRRRGKAFSSLVVFLKRAVGTAESM